VGRGGLPRVLARGHAGGRGGRCCCGGGSLQRALGRCRTGAAAGTSTRTSGARRA
jgi:hypothetical protein